MDKIIVLFFDTWFYYLTVSLDLPNTTKISGGKLPATYKALQVHYHWGKDGGPGAEHTIDGEQYPMEVIKKKYGSLMSPLCMFCMFKSIMGVCAINRCILST